MKVDLLLFSVTKFLVVNVIPIKYCDNLKYQVGVF